jgi:hypothetical protein
VGSVGWPANGHPTEHQKSPQIERDLSGIRRAMRKSLEAESAKGGLTAPQSGVMQVCCQSGDQFEGLGP